MTQPPPIVLSFAASDPSSGAGIQADVVTLASLGCYPLTVITAITVQDTTGVEHVEALDPDLVADQARAVLEDMPVDVFKIGLLGSVEIIAIIAEIISDYPDIPLILDPVITSGHGDELADEDMVLAMQELLIPQVTILTPNSLEARQLVQEEDDIDEDERVLGLSQCADKLLQMGCEYILITGAHENTSQVVNTLYGSEGVLRTDKWPRLPASYHGSGCTLAAAIAAYTANGSPIEACVYEAQNYTWQALKAGFRLGMGQCLPNRMFWVNDNNNAPKS